MSTDASERLAHLRSRLTEACGHEPLIQPATVQVSLHGNSLVLTGLVPHAAAKQRITELAEAMAPDLRVDNSCVVDAMHVPSDEALTQRAGDWLRRTFGAEADSMGVVVSGGKAMLLGTWPTVDAVEQARQDIGRFPGIHTVDPSSATLSHQIELPDAGMMPMEGISVVNALEERLAKGGYRLGDWVDAHMRHGILELVGLVDDAEARQRVVGLASQLSGVRRVVDHLTVRDGSRSGDAAVEQRIRHAWTGSAQKLSTPDLQLFVFGDQAFVSGTVPSPQVKSAALKIVRQDPAIGHVIDRITMNRPYPRSA